MPRPYPQIQIKLTSKKNTPKSNAQSGISQLKTKQGAEDCALKIFFYFAEQLRPCGIIARDKPFIGGQFF